MLRAAFNILTGLHSRVGQIKRPGSPDIYSPCRLTPSNYFRFLRGPDSTVIRGREYVIPLDSLLGQFAQVVSFSLTPAAGTFKLDYNGNLTTALAFNSSSAAVQTALRLLPGLTNVLVTGSMASGLIVTFAGFSAVPILLLPADHATLVDGVAAAVTITVSQTYQAWSDVFKRGDKIIDSVYGLQAVDEIIEMVDLGGAVMGFRIRCE